MHMIDLTTGLYQRGHCNSLVNHFESCLCGGVSIVSLWSSPVKDNSIVNTKYNLSKEKFPCVKGS